MMVAINARNPIGSLSQRGTRRNMDSLESLAAWALKRDFNIGLLAGPNDLIPHG
jgi:hypothetical protein